MPAKKKPAPKKKPAAKQKTAAPKKKAAAPKKKAAAQVKATSPKASAARLKLKTYPEGEEGIDLVCETKMPDKNIPRALELSPSGRFVVVGHMDEVCTVIDVELGETRDLAPANAHVEFVGFPDRETALIGDSTGLMRIVELRSGTERVIVAARKKKDLFRLTVGERLAAYSLVGDPIRIWREGTGEEELDVEQRGPSITVDGDMIYSGTESQAGSIAVVAWDAKSGKLARTLTAVAGDFVDDIVVAGTRVVAVTRAEKPAVVVWDESGANTVNVVLDADPVTCVTVLDDGKRLAVAQEQGTLTHVNLVDGTMSVGSMAPWRLSSAQGNMGAVVHDRKRVGIYDLDTRTLLLERACKHIITADLAPDRVTMMTCSWNGEIGVYRAHPPG
jgi:hypothetical protein